MARSDPSKLHITQWPVLARTLKASLGPGHSGCESCPIRTTIFFLICPGLSGWKEARRRSRKPDRVLFRSFAHHCFDEDASTSPDGTFAQACSPIAMSRLLRRTRCRSGCPCRRTPTVGTRQHRYRRPLADAASRLQPFNPVRMAACRQTPDQSLKRVAQISAQLSTVLVHLSLSECGVGPSQRRSYSEHLGRLSSLLNSSAANCTTDPGSVGGGASARSGPHPQSLVVKPC